MYSFKYQRAKSVSDAAAVISAVCGAPDPGQATARFLEAIHGRHRAPDGR